MFFQLKGDNFANLFLFIYLAISYHNFSTVWNFDEEISVLRLKPSSK